MIRNLKKHAVENRGELGFNPPPGPRGGVPGGFGNRRMGGGIADFDSGLEDDSDDFANYGAGMMGMDDEFGTPLF